MSEHPEGSDAPEPGAPKKSNRRRLFLVAVVFAALWVIGKQSGAVDRLDVDTFRNTVESAGAWGFLVFIAGFVIGELVHVPGMIFVAGGILAYGKLVGFMLSLIAAILSVSVSFAVVRAVGGKALAEIERPFVKKMLARLEQRPITTVIVLRMIFWIAPTLNYALALTAIRFRDYVIGSTIGLFGPICGAALLFDWLIAYLRA